MLLLLLGMAFSQVVEAPAVGVRWQTLPPITLDVTGPDTIQVLLRGVVENMGDDTSRSFAWFVGEVPGPEIFGEQTIIGPLNGTPEDPLMTFQIALVPDTTYVVQFLFNDSGTFLPAPVPPPAGVITFLTPSLEILVTEEHPLSDELSALGLNPTFALVVIGGLLMVLALVIVSLLAEGSDKELIPVLVMSASANVFLRFWPAIVLIFLALFTGWILVSRLTSGDGGRGLGGG